MKTLFRFVAVMLLLSLDRGRPGRGAPSSGWIPLSTTSCRQTKVGEEVRRQFVFGRRPVGCAAAAF